MAGIAMLKMQVEVGRVTDPVPAQGAAEPVRLSHKLPVLQHLGGNTGIDTVPGMFQIVTEIQRG